MKRIVENLAFDQIYHEHLLYYNLKNIETLLNRHGLALYDCYLAADPRRLDDRLRHPSSKRPPSQRLLDARRAETRRIAITSTPTANSPAALRR